MIRENPQKKGAGTFAAKVPAPFFLSTPVSAAAIATIFAPVAAVLGAIATVLRPVEDVLDPIADAGVRPPVADVFEPVAAILRPVATVFLTIANIFDAIATLGRGVTLWMRERGDGRQCQGHESGDGDLHGARHG
jgi:hypothetical protein